MNFSDILKQILKEEETGGVAWKIELCMLDMGGIRRVANMNDIVKKAWNRFGVKEMESDELFHERPLLVQFSWALAMCLVSTATKCVHCFAMGGDEDARGLRLFVEGVILALRMKH
eukprot:GABV01008115.1.p1 GENE.GABV01008115.1~~GABV01008115.1.p1  ORF type:complete len:116 (-),score=23.87 GABV01008115.1:11-358(-)